MHYDGCHGARTIPDLQHHMVVWIIDLGKRGTV